MVDTIKLDAEPREEFGKGAARRIRRANKVPAVLYANGHDPLHVTLPGHKTMLALRQANALLSIQRPGAPEQLALPKQVQRHPVTNSIEHVDLLMVFRGERVSVQIPVVVVGEPEGDVLVNTERTEITVEAEATSIPAYFEVSIAGLEVGAQILVGDVALPEGVTLDDDAEALVLSINAPVAVEETLESAEDEEGADEDAGEGDSEE